MKILIGILLANAITFAYSAPFYPPNFYLKGPVHKATIYGPDGKETISIADAGSISTKGIEGSKFSAYASDGQSDSSKAVGNNCGNGGACGSDSAPLEGEGTQLDTSFVQLQGNSNPRDAHQPDVIIIGPTMTAAINGATNGKGCDNGCSKGVSSYNENIGSEGQYTPEGSASSSDYGQVPYSNDNNEAPSIGTTGSVGGEGFIGEVSQNTYQNPSPNTFVADSSSSNDPQDQRNEIETDDNLNQPSSSIDYSSNSDGSPKIVDQTQYSSGNSYLPPTNDGSYESSSFAPATFEQPDTTNLHQYPSSTYDSTHSDAGINEAGKTAYDFGSGNDGYGNPSTINTQVQDQDANGHVADNQNYYESSSFPSATYSDPNSVHISRGDIRNLKNYDCYVIKFPISSSGLPSPAEYGLFLQKLASFNTGVIDQHKHHHHHHRHY